MRKTISIGKQSFSSLREHDNFFVDKTNFIKEWWEKEDDITLIARPRRFGKTLNMSMLECFFSNKYANRADLFEGLSIWEEEKYRQLQGTYPVIFLSFASVKADNLMEAKIQIKQEIAVLYEENRYLLKKDILSDNERRLYNRTTEQMDDTTAQKAIRNMAAWMYRYYGKNVIILLDEYDTPMQEAYLQGYWDEYTSFIRSLFNATFKTNSYLERAIMTGITRVISADGPVRWAMESRTHGWRTCIQQSRRRRWRQWDFMPRRRTRNTKCMCLTGTVSVNMWKTV